MKRYELYASCVLHIIYLAANVCCKPITSHFPLMYDVATCHKVGVHIDRQSISYVASQPWPFPRSCMIGMAARSRDGLAPIQIDPHEIVDAQWFEKETVYQAARDSDSMGAVLEPQVVQEKQEKGEWNGKLLVPSKGVLARTLVDHWLEE